MPTAAELALFTDKKLMGFEDFDDRLLRYLQNDIRQSVKRLFIQGSFAEKMPLASAAINQVQANLKVVAGDGFAHDGAGRLLDLEQIDRTAFFENVTGTTYEVGAGYIEYPFEIRNNPRTGKPEYDRYVEGVGVEATPNSITNNGMNLTIRVDSLFEQGVAIPSHAGRIVRVFKKTPADGALLAVDAIETATVFFAGGQNQITTAGLLGQTTISTTPSDYVVQLVGLIVLKDTATNRPSLNPAGSFFLGTVDGLTGSIPVTFDITGQAIIQAQAANGIVFLPFTGAAPISWDIAATDVQAAIEEVVADLTNVGAGTDGARLIGLSSSTFTQQNPSASLSWGGLGTAGDHVFSKFTDADRALAKRSFGITHSANTATMQADEQGVDTIGSTFTDERHWLKGASDLVFSGAVTDLDLDSIPTVEGESMNKTRLFGPAAVASFNWYGRYRDLQIGTTLSATLGSTGFFEAEKCSIAPNAFIMGAGRGPDETALGAFGHMQHHILRDCYIPSTMAGAGTPLTNFFTSSLLSSSGGVHLIENTVFEGSGTGPTLRYHGTSHIQRQNITVYRNCIFRGSVSTAPVLEIAGNGAVFIDCRIEKTNTDGFDAAVELQNIGSTMFVRCHIHSENGNAIQTFAGTTLGSPYRGLFQQCQITTGAGPVTDGSPQLCEAYSCWFDDCSFVAGQASNAPTAGVSQVVEINFGYTRNCHFSTTGWTDMHNYTTWFFNGGECRDCSFSIPSEQSTTLWGDSADGAHVKMVGVKASGITIAGSIALNASNTPNTHSVLSVGEDTTIYDLTISVSTITGGANTGLNSYINMYGRNSKIERALLTYSGASSPQVFSTRAYIWMHNHQQTVRGVEIDNISWTFGADSGIDLLFLLDGYNVSVEDCVSPVIQNLEARMNWIFIDGGDQIMIKGNRFRMDPAATTERFVYGRNTNQDAWNIMVVNNLFAWRAGTTNPTNGRWIDLSSTGAGLQGRQSLVDGNQLLNGFSPGGTTPAIQNAGVGAVTGDNVLVAGAQLYIA